MQEVKCCQLKIRGRVLEPDPIKLAEREKLLGAPAGMGNKPN
jgi:hypothetical protein